MPSKKRKTVALRLRRRMNIPVRILIIFLKPNNKKRLFKIQSTTYLMN